jgi:hypothetical protein
VNELRHTIKRKDLMPYHTPHGRPLAPVLAGCSDNKKTIEEKNTNYIITMTSRAAGPSGPRSRKGFAYDPQRITAVGEKPAVVNESAGGLFGNEKIESLLTDIVSRLDRIEEKIEENVYPPESAIKPEFIKKVKKAQTDIKKGKGKTYNSIDDFFKEIKT